MLSEVEKAKSLLNARRLQQAVETRCRDQEDEVVDAKDAGAVISNLGPYAPKSVLSSNGFPRSSEGGDYEGRLIRRAERQKRRNRRFSGQGTLGNVSVRPGAGEEWVGSKSFPWARKDRVEIWQALESGGEESEGEQERFERSLGGVIEAADIVMEDVDDDVKVGGWVGG